MTSDSEPNRKIMTEAQAIRQLRKTARSRVAFPSMAVAIMAIFGTIMSVAWIAFATSEYVNKPSTRNLLLALTGIPAFCWCSFLFIGAIHMNGLKNLKLARISMWMGVVPIPVPLYLIWFIGAILGITVLNDRAVQTAFRSGNGNLRQQFLKRHRERFGITGNEAIEVNEDIEREQIGKKAKAARAMVLVCTIILLLTWTLSSVLTLALLYSVYISQQIHVGPLLEELLLVSILFIILGFVGAVLLHRHNSLFWGVTSAILIVFGSNTCLFGLVPSLIVLFMLFDQRKNMQLITRQGRKPSSRNPADEQFASEVE